MYRMLTLGFLAYASCTAAVAFGPEKPFEPPPFIPDRPYTNPSDDNPFLPIIIIAWGIFGPLTLFWTLLMMLIEKISDGQIEDSGFNPLDGYNPGRALASAALTFGPFILVAIFRSS